MQKALKDVSDGAHKQAQSKNLFFCFTIFHDNDSMMALMSCCLLHFYLIPLLWHLIIYFTF